MTWGYSKYSKLTRAFSADGFETFKNAFASDRIMKKSEIFFLGHEFV